MEIERLMVRMRLDVDLSCAGALYLVRSLLQKTFFFLVPVLVLIPSMRGQDRDAMLQSAYEYLAEEEFELARQQFDLLTNYNSRDAEALLGLGICAYHEQDFDEAAYKLGRAIDYEDEDARAWYWLGRVSFDRRQFEAAWYNFNDAWHLDSLVGNIDYYRGASAYQVGLDSIASHSLSKFVAENPGHAYAQYYLGMSHIQNGNTAEALQRFNEAIAIDDRIPRFHVGKGDAYAEQGNYILASISYRAATRRNPDYGEAWYRLSWSLSESGQRVSAYDAARKASEMLADDPDVLFHLAQTAYGAGQYKSAKRVLVDNQERIGQPNEANFLLGKIYAAMGDNESAYILYSSVEEMDPGRDDVQFEWGNACFNMERFEEAADLYTKCLTRNPGDPLYTYNIGIVRALQGEEELACEFFQRVLDEGDEAMRSQAEVARETYCGK